MPILEDLKAYAERATGLRRPGKRDAPELVRARKPHTVRFKDDGLVPNHPRWPLIVYRSAASSASTMIRQRSSRTCSRRTDGVRTP